MKNLSFVLFISAALTLCNLAMARGPVSDGEFVLSSTDLEKVVRDKSGRVIERFVTHYNKNGDVRGTSHTTNTFSDGRIVSSLTEHMDSAGDLSRQQTTRWYRDRKGQMIRVLRLWANADQEQTRRENAYWDVDKKANITMVTTEIYDADDVHIETRYTIHTYDNGRLFSSDTSAFKVNERQMWRHYTEYSARLTKHWSFDADDEIKRREVVKKTKNRHGHTMAIDAETFDKNDELTGSRAEEFVHFRGHTKKHTVTWFDTNDQGIRRMTATYDLDSHGRTLSKRVNWEHWADE